VSAVIEKKPRRIVCPTPAPNSVKIIPATKPMTTDEMIRLVEKARQEKDPGKVRQITDQIMDGFYGRKTVAV
jgi:hypothetical protein